MLEPTNALASERCRCLRTKEMFVQVEGPVNIFQSGSGIYWCVHTQNCLGPDGQTVEPSSCTQGRSCFEAV